MSSLFSLFAAVALALSAVGLASTISFQVKRRTHEIGIRFALGATRAKVLYSILVPTMRTVLIGLASGMLLSAALSQFAFRWIHASIRGLPLLVGVAMLLLCVALLAALATARRGAQY